MIGCRPRHCRPRMMLGIRQLSTPIGQRSTRFDARLGVLLQYSTQPSRTESRLRRALRLSGRRSTQPWLSHHALSTWFGMALGSCRGSTQRLLSHGRTSIDCTAVQSRRAFDMLWRRFAAGLERGFGPVCAQRGLDPNGGRRRGGGSTLSIPAHFQSREVCSSAMAQLAVC